MDLQCGSVHSPPTILGGGKLSIRCDKRLEHAYIYVNGERVSICLSKGELDGRISLTHTQAGVGAI